MNDLNGPSGIDQALLTNQIFNFSNIKNALTAKNHLSGQVVLNEEGKIGVQTQQAPLRAKSNLEVKRPRNKVATTKNTLQTSLMTTGEPKLELKNNLTQKEDKTTTAVTATKSKRFIDSTDFITVPQITMRTNSKTGS